MSVLYRKSWQDIRRRAGRSVFTIVTIAAGVSGLSFFALPVLMDRAMDDRIATDRLHDVRVHVEDVAFEAADAEALLAIPGVESVEARSTYRGNMLIGERREDVLLVGVPGFEDQQVNVVTVDGAVPSDGQVVTDVQNARSGRLSVAQGETVTVFDDAREPQELEVTGTGRTLEFTQIVGFGVVVLYAPQETVNRIAGASGVNSIEVRVDDASDAEALSDEVQAALRERHPGIVFTDLPDVRPAGTWPGEEVFNNFSTLFYVGAILALVSAVALISNTMTTMVAEQRREFAIMKAIGGSRRQVAFSFLRTVALLATAGSLLGVAIGIPFSNLLAQFVGNEFLATKPAWGIAWPIVGMGLLVGIAGTTLAALPALLRAARTPVHQGLNPSSNAAGGGGGFLRWLRLPAVGRIGLRNMARRKTRAAGTVVQVGIAAGVALGFLALGVTVTRLTAETWDTFSWDVALNQSSNTPLDDGAAAALAELDGVETVHPVLYNFVRIDGRQYEVFAIAKGNDLYLPDIAEGRWLEPSDSDNRSRVAVVGRALAGRLGIEPGEAFTATTANGDVELTLVGIDSRIVNNGDGMYVPLETFQDVLGRDDANGFWLVASDGDRANVDRLATAAQDALAAAGYPVSVDIRYVERQANIENNETLVTVLAAMGIPIVIIGLIGLVNMMTMNVIERTREIGILRCIGARSGDIRRIFRTEALAVAALGWLIAVPLGWLIGKSLVQIVSNLFNFGSIPYVFPLWYPPIALLVTLGLAWVIVIPPLRRAARLRPGDALRYE